MIFRKMMIPWKSVHACPWGPGATRAPGNAWASGPLRLGVGVSGFPWPGTAWTPLGKKMRPHRLRPGENETAWNPPGRKMKPHGIRPGEK